MLERNVLRLAAGSTVLGVVLAATAAGLAGPWDGGQRTAERDRAAARSATGGAHHGGSAAPGAAARPGPAPAPVPAPSAPAVLTPLTAPARVRAAPAPGLAGALDPLFRVPGLGAPRTAAVVDVATGRRLYEHGAAAPMPPASTIKIATTAAALSALGPDHRLTTTVVASRDARTVTLVGGGDPTLDGSRLKALAAATAKALRARRVTPAALTYDTSLYEGPVRHRIGANDNIAPVTPLMTDAARLDGSVSGPAPRAADPAGETARAFARLLAAQGVKVPPAPRPGRAPHEPLRLAATHSAPLSALVERTLTYSDNDLAEALARATARATRHPAGFDGAGRAVRAQLGRLGVPLDGAVLRDGSGLDRRNRVSARLLTALLARAADPARPELRPVLTGLPVGGFSGTLEDRYTDGSPAAGLIRAKTGTLTGVNALAGTAVTRDGRLLAFAFLASNTPSPYEAQPALDALATTLTTS
ncbi:D-alanyl-D-alanine carboxypeptidase/D-alanyl-D-alanine endopeptidase [Streptomyces roseolilacinus]|uniref:D-alanyl-D-alanine carboxypeptidase n=1 Tax=Streptomyces roseolilacinus TaxID=66904 RepID=A0A918ENY7_9ACTN|nr:D-alanyl-D-alanine carboxypeptidase/D-alanyl-D-alanine-endopeptidase [Streptomyces roseolilacinus]GGQ28759.1 D-alanyl-D-alanine carboxypeptidase [Streptomyces roseolilacinus]